MNPSPFETPSFIKPHPDGVCLAVKAQPRAARNEIVGPAGAELKIRITAPPVDSAANEALLRFLSEKLACPRGALHLLRGHNGRHKQVLVQGLTADQVLARLEWD